MAQKTAQNYLDEFKSQWITDVNRLKTWYDKWMSTLTWENQIAFKNAYNQYTSSLPNTQTNKTTAQDVINKITPSNAQNTLNTAQKAYSSWQLSNADYLTIKNNAQNVKYNELNPNPSTSPVTSSPWNIQATSTNTNTKATSTNTNTQTNIWVSLDWITNSQQAQQWIINQIKENATANDEAIRAREADINARIAEDEKIKNEKTAQAEKAYSAYEENIRNMNEKQAWFENEMRTMINDMLWRDLQNYQKTLDTQTNLQVAAQELQTYNDNKAITDYERKLEVQQMQSAWAFNKMWAAFSSSAITTWNKIAMDWAEAIAWLKVKANYNQAKIANDAAELQFEYQKDINNTIDKYTELWLKLKQQSIERVYNTTNSIISNDKEKQEQVNKISDEYIKSKRKLADDLYAELKTDRDRRLEQVQLLQQEMQAMEEINLEKSRLRVASWEYAQMSIADRRRLEWEAWLPPWTLDADMHSQINKLITETFDAVLWAWSLVTNREAMVQEIIQEMKNGRNLETAATYVIERSLKTNPEYLAKQEAAKQKATLYTAETNEKLSSMWINDFSSLYTGSNWPAYANNNPWNIKDVWFWGEAGWRGWFTKFNTIEDWMNALISKLDYNKANWVNWVNNGSAYNGNMTLLQYIQKYAPSSDWNNPENYASIVANKLWVATWTQIKDLNSNRLAVEIAKHENGGVYNEMVKRWLIVNWEYVWGSSWGKYSRVEIRDLFNQKWLSATEAEINQLASSNKDVVNSYLLNKEEAKNANKWDAKLTATEKNQKNAIDTWIANLSFLWGDKNASIGWVAWVVQNLNKNWKDLTSITNELAFNFPSAKEVETQKEEINTIINKSNSLDDIVDWIFSVNTLLSDRIYEKLSEYAKLNMSDEEVIKEIKNIVSNYKQNPKLYFSDWVLHEDRLIDRKYNIDDLIRYKPK